MFNPVFVTLFLNNLGAFKNSSSLLLPVIRQLFPGRRKGENIDGPLWTAAQLGSISDTRERSFFGRQRPRALRGKIFDRHFGAWRPQLLLPS